MPLGDFRGSRNWLFVKVMTDAGIYGVGECSGWPEGDRRGGEGSVEPARRAGSGNIDLLWNKMHTATMGHGLARHGGWRRR